MTLNGLLTTTSIHFDPTGTWLGITLLTGAFAGLLFFLAPDKSRLSSGRRLALVSLRTAAFLVLLFCMMKPSIVAIRRLQQPATVLVLADSSESMNVADGLNGKTRWEYLRETLRSAMESTLGGSLAETLHFNFQKRVLGSVARALVVARRTRARTGGSRAWRPPATKRLRCRGR